ncbi:hypothetical protein [Butyrivibrio sp. AE3003]|uniref:hypothetical protein n=1 Tax=Butyrivibrio sp. AE3003 TaxID=1496721 RepID=UPI000AC70D11|nr:hypothetical protein [Butyrivibrio sp. AE3003]
MNNKEKNQRIIKRFLEQSAVGFDNSIEPVSDKKYKIVDVDSMDEFLKLIGKKRKDED